MIDKDGQAIHRGMNVRYRDRIYEVRWLLKSIYCISLTDINYRKNLGPIALASDCEIVEYL